MVWLNDGEKTLRICVTVYTQYRRVTDRQMDRQTSCHGIVCAMHKHHTVKTVMFSAELQRSSHMSVILIYSLYILRI